MEFKAYVLSLENCTERRIWIESIKPKLGFEFEFFDAFTPDEITQDYKDKFINSDFHEWDINHDAVIATFLSHSTLLMKSISDNQNLLVIEDDVDIITNVDWSKFNFRQFDMLNLGDKEISCFAYFITPNGARKILENIYNKDYTITQAFDWELHKLKDTVRIKSIAKPIFTQVDRFESNIAPNGYNKR